MSVTNGKIDLLTGPIDPGANRSEINQLITDINTIDATLGNSEVFGPVTSTIHSIPTWSNTTGSGLENNSALTVTGGNNIHATTFTGALVGNADTATVLATARTIAGVSFNGSANIAIGLGNLSDAKTDYPNLNMFIGTGVGATTTTGQNNTAAGAACLASVTSGIANTCFGDGNLNGVTTGGYNTVIGQTGFYNLTTGSDNIAIGYHGAPTLVTGSGNILIGDSLDVAGAATSNTLNIGGVITATGMNVPATSTVTVPGALTVTGTITGPGTGLTGTATSLTAGASNAVKTSSTSADAPYFIGLLSSNSDSQQLYYLNNNAFSFDPGTNVLTAGTFTGATTTQTAGDNSTKLATTAYVDQGAAINTQSGDYTLALTDAGTFIDMTKGTATVLTIPANGSIAFPVGTEIIIRQGGAGQVTVAITSDTLNNPAATLKLRAQYSQVTIKKMASTTWTIIGDLAAS